MTVPRCVLYSRFSPRPGGESESIKMQEGEMREFCRSNGWAVCNVFSDENASGSDPEREGLWSAMDAVPKGGILLVWKMDRLARDLYLNEALHRHAAKHKFTIQAVRDGPVDDSAEGVLIRQVLAAAAEYERRLIQARTSVAMKRHQKEGRRMSRYAPFGYDVSSEDSTRLVENSEEQTILKTMHDLRKVGFGWRTIAQKLTDGGYRPRGTKWDASSIRKIVQRQYGPT